MFRDDLTRLQHMLNSANEALLFIDNKTRKDLNNDRMLVLSLVKCIEIIGEAANKISEELKAKHSSVPWKDIVGMRHRLIHVYFDIDYNIVWKSVTEELPVLKEELQKIIRLL